MKNKENKLNLDKEEQELLRSIEAGEWKSVDNLEQEKEVAKRAAANHLRKNARINIRISNEVLEQLKRKAAYEGIPYQTLISSILHKYVSGHFD